MQFKRLTWNKIKGNKLVIQESNNLIFNHFSIDFRIIIGYDEKMYLVDFNQIGTNYNTKLIHSVEEGEKVAQKLFEEKCRIIMEAILSSEELLNVRNSNQ